MRATIAQPTDPRPKAPEDGLYEFNGGRFRVRKGRPMPPGARFVEPSGATDEEATERATARRQRKPSENAQGPGPSETS